MRIVATSARVAVPRGSRRPSSLPEMRPKETAHFTESPAQVLTLPLYAELPLEVVDEICDVILGGV